MASFGNYCLLLGLCLSVFAFLASVLGFWQREERFLRSAERAVYAATGSVVLAFLALLYLLLANDFSTSHVANSSSQDLPVFYKIAAMWGGHDGSMLLWVFFTAILCAIVVYQNRARYRDMMPYVVGVLTFNLSFFLFLNFCGRTLYLSGGGRRKLQTVHDRICLFGALTVSIIEINGNAGDGVVVQK